MADPVVITVSGAVEGFNGRMSNTVLGAVDLRVNTIQIEVAIRTRESDSAQHKVLYPQYVSSGSFSLGLIHKTLAERDAFNQWVAQYMERASSNRLSSAWVTVSVPARRFTRKAVPRGTLNFGDSTEQRGKPYTTTLQFVAASDPTSRITSVSRVLHSADPSLLTHYPSGVQAGWSYEESVYDRPPTPGGPVRDRPV